MVNIENTFIISRDALPKEPLKENKSYEINLKGYIVYPINQQIELWTNGEGLRQMAVSDIGEVRILRDKHYSKPGTGEIYTRVKFEVISLKENGLGRKIQT